MNPTRSKVLVAAALLAVPALSSCGVNFDAQTDQVYTPSDGENSYEGDVDVLNAMIVSETAGSGRFIATLVNNVTSEADTLESVQGVGDSAEVTFSIEGGETEIPPGGSLQLSLDESAMVAASGSEDLLAPGLFVRVSVSFANGEAAELNVPVMAPGETYEDVELP